MRTLRFLFPLPALCAAGLVAWAVPFLRFGPFAYGYDSGLYRRYLLEPFVSFPNTPVPGLDHTIFLPRMLLDIVRFLIRDTDTVLYGTYFALGAVAVASVYLFARNYLGQWGAAAATLLYILSAIQFLAHESFFFKQMVALPLFLFGLYALESRRYVLAGAMGILIVLTHQTSAILFLVLGGASFVVRAVMTRSLPLMHAFSMAGVAAMYLLLHPHVARKVVAPPVGVFISQQEYLLWSLPILLLAVLGLRRFVPIARQNPVLTASLVTLLAFIALKLPFYSRVYVFVDLLLVIPAACGVLTLYDFARKQGRMFAVPAMIATFVIAALPMLHLQWTKEPPLTPDVQATVRSLDALPAGSSLITSPALLPWAQGWSRAKVHAPGIFKEPHSSEEWKQYWSHTNPRFDQAFLASFPQPAYVFARPVEGSYIPVCSTEHLPFLYAVAPCL